MQQGTLEGTDPIGLGAIFTLLVVMLGPFKIIGPFKQLTAGIDDTTTRQVSLLAFVYSLGTVVLGGFLGKVLLHNWGVSVPALLIAGGIIFFLVGLSLVLEQYHAEHPSLVPLPAAPTPAALRITFPLVVTPYGIAAVIVLLSNSHHAARTISILAIMVAVMILNLLAMLYARRTGGGALLVLSIFGAVLGVLQVALAVEMIVRGLRGLGVLDG